MFLTFFVNRREAFFDNFIGTVIWIIVGIILAMPLLAALTGVRLHPYRYVPLIVFFGIGVGMLLSNKISQVRGLNSV